MAFFTTLWVLHLMKNVKRQMETVEQTNKLETLGKTLACDGQCIERRWFFYHQSNKIEMFHFKTSRKNSMVIAALTVVRYDRVHNIVQIDTLCHVAISFALFNCEPANTKLQQSLRCHKCNRNANLGNNRLKFTTRLCNELFTQWTTETSEKNHHKMNFSVCVIVVRIRTQFTAVFFWFVHWNWISHIYFHRIWRQITVRISTKIVRTLKN